LFIIGWVGTNHAFVKNVLQWRRNVAVPTWLKPPLILLPRVPISPPRYDVTAQSVCKPEKTCNRRLSVERRCWSMRSARSVRSVRSARSVRRTRRKRRRAQPLCDRFLLSLDPESPPRSLTHSEAITVTLEYIFFRETVLNEWLSLQAELSLRPTEGRAFSYSRKKCVLLALMSCPYYGQCRAFYLPITTPTTKSKLQYKETHYLILQASKAVSNISEQTVCLSIAN
jgi:hypothetical protein